MNKSVVFTVFRKILRVIGAVMVFVLASAAAQNMASNPRPRAADLGLRVVSSHSGSTRCNHRCCGGCGWARAGEAGWVLGGGAGANQFWRRADDGRGARGARAGSLLLTRRTTATGQTIDRGAGSVMIVVATDAPMDARNLKRLAARSLMGVARTGSADRMAAETMRLHFPPPRKCAYERKRRRWC